MYKVRFNLGRGKRYMTWKITKPNGEVDYLNPKEVFLVLSNCTLKNNKNTARKIYEGANKRVCAYVLCEDVEVLESRDYEIGDKITYNPRVKPNWFNVSGEDIDGANINKIVSDKYTLYEKK